jgi:hypothetical protein
MSEMWDIYQMINSIMLQMDKAETPENEELFEKIRWALQEMELKLTRVYNSAAILEDSLTKFMDAHKCIEEELQQRYIRPDGGEFR